jgi:hypothetical protein
LTQNKHPHVLHQQSVSIEITARSHAANSMTCFQVELHEDSTDNKGNLQPGEPTYFQVMQGHNSFTMFSAARNSDPHCTGREIIYRH